MTDRAAALKLLRRLLDNQGAEFRDGQREAIDAHDLDGAFALEGQVQEGTVLLVDDIVDSKRTLTVVAALLWEAGCTAVLPFALATASLGG